MGFMIGHTKRRMPSLHLTRLDIGAAVARLARAKWRREEGFIVVVVGGIWCETEENECR